MGSTPNRSLCVTLKTWTALLLSLVLITLPLAWLGVASPGAAAATPATVFVQFGTDLAPAVRSRIEGLLRTAAVTQTVEIRGAGDSLAGLPSGAIIISFGDTTATRKLVGEAELEALGSEGFIVRSGKVRGRKAIAADGNPPDPDRYGLGINAGLSFGSYALLEELGFAFLHPLQPVIPASLKLGAGSVNLTEKPFWPDRGIHVHTMHPLELTNVLNCWGKTGPEDEAGWREMLPEWESFLEWAVANRQNSAEWVLLAAASWKEFAGGPVRQARLAELVGMAHDLGIAVGVDVPFALQQQHSWFMVEQPGTLEEETAQIRSRIDWLMAAGFDFLGGEMGTGEFASTDDTRFVEWMDEAARYLDESHGGKRLYMKIHCSTGQEAQNYTDPETGEPMNYNFIVHYADPRVGIMPHSVQVYSLDDPAPTYGNTDFGYMREFMQEEAGAREVRWHPEAAYWCAYDIDMPLFLPVYAERRLHDMRLIAADEAAGRMGRGEHAGSRIQGQMLFSSGWEWGYWLNDVVAARAAWQPFADEPDDEAAFRKALRPVVRPFGARADEVADLLVRTVEAQQDILIEGRVDGLPPANISMRNGQAYLEGWDSLDDLGDLLGLIPFVDPIHAQVDKLQLVGLYNFQWYEPAPLYSEIEPLLLEMEEALSGLAGEYKALKPAIPRRTRPLFAELCDASRITALRAVQVRGLYDYVFRWDDPVSWRRERLEAAREALDAAMPIAAKREALYRVEPHRIAGWHYNPTSYGFGYLWTVRTLWYWWRDEGKAVDQPFRPGYMNIANPIDQALGEGDLLELTKQLRRLGDLIFPGLLEITAAPDAEPTVPPYNLRSRP